MYSIYNQFILLVVGGGRVSEVKKVNKVLRGERHSATFWVVGCARMVCVLRKETDVTINAFFLNFSFNLARISVPCWL